MENQLRQEIINGIQQRQKLDLTKISFISAFFGAGGLKLNGQPTLHEIYYIIPLVAVFFDLLIMGQTFSLRRVGAFLRSHSTNPLHREYEEFAKEHRDKYFKYGSLLITFLSIIAATFLTYISNNNSLTKIEISWFVLVLVLFIVAIGWGNRIIGKIENYQRKYKIIKASVAAIMVKENTEEILLTKRAIPPFEDKWCLPGGHIEFKQNAEQAIIREVEEETGLKFTPEFFKYFDEILPEIDHHNVVLVYSGIITDDKNLLSENEEVKATKWFSSKEIKELELAYNHKLIMKEYYEQKRKNQK